MFNYWPKKNKKKINKVLLYFVSVKNVVFINLIRLPKRLCMNKCRILCTVLLLCKDFSLTLDCKCPSCFTPIAALLFACVWSISRVNSLCLPRHSGGLLATWSHSAVSLRLTLAPGSQVHVSLKYTAQKRVCERRGSCVYVYCSNELQTPVSTSKLLITGISY